MFVVFVVYLIGLVLFVVVVSFVMGLVDLCLYGFKNFGVINVLCSGNKKVVILMFVGDVFKGWIVVWFVCYFGLFDVVVVWVVIVVFFGYLYLVFFCF